ncbi:MAG: hypothetical protein RI897_1704 [Verrucomicrobiota bacterium]|jgi:predicted alpha-1,2-mannosidase
MQHPNPPNRTRLKTWLRRILLTLIILITPPLLLLTALYLRHRSIVQAKPLAPLTSVTAGPLGQYVNPFIGTGGYPWVCGHTFPGATTPFGMVRLGPETTSFLSRNRALNTSGYYYGDNQILGFSHTRLIGTGATDGGLCLVTPSLTTPGHTKPAKPKPLHFSHREEQASPGYYAVRLPQISTLVELTATPRTGIHRYTFPKEGTALLHLDFSHALGHGHSTDTALRILPETQEIEGSTRLFGSFSSRYGGLPCYLVARLDTSSPASGISHSTNGSATLSFNPTGQPRTITLNIGISFTSLQNARANLDNETQGQSFDQLLALAQTDWEHRLAQIQIQEGADDQRTIFYSALYRAFQMPTVFSDTNGQYPGFDGNIHSADGFRYFTDLSLWDTFRTIHPLYNLIARDDQRDMITSLLTMQEQGGWLPRWPSGTGYSNSMLGTPADIVIAESYLKGITNFDVQHAYSAMRQTALAPTPPNAAFSGREGIQDYLNHGYCTVGPENETVSRTLEFAWYDHAIARLAEQLGHHDDAALFTAHSHFYTNLWNPETAYFQPRYASGEFFTPFKPLLLTYLDRGNRFTRDYVEGSAQQWRWMVPHDPQGLIRLFGNKERFASELNAFFENSTPNQGAWNPGPHYWHGNEPDIHAAYLFNAADRPDLTRKWTRWILYHKYSTSYDGIDGNDDAGTLSAWYVLSALGLYPIAGTDRYELGLPLFQSATLQVGDSTLIIQTSANPTLFPHVKSIHLNGQTLATTHLQHQDIAQGGTLEFTLASQ